MSTIEELRKQAIAQQIRKMAGDEPTEIQPPTPKEPEEKPQEKRQEKQNEKPQEKPMEKPNETVSSNVDFETYQKTFLAPSVFENRASFSLNRETMDVLRFILYDLRSKTTLSAYIENILREHVHRHKELIGKTIEKNRRKPFIP